MLHQQSAYFRTPAYIDMNNTLFSHHELSHYIGKYEVTNAQYCDFLNCVAQKADSNRLFSPLMQQHFFGANNQERHSRIYWRYYQDALWRQTLWHKRNKLQTK